LLVAEGVCWLRRAFAGCGGHLLVAEGVCWCCWLRNTILRLSAGVVLRCVAICCEMLRETHPDARGVRGPAQRIRSCDGRTRARLVRCCVPHWARQRGGRHGAAGLLRCRVFCCAQAATPRQRPCRARGRWSMTAFASAQAIAPGRRAPPFLPFASFRSAPPGTRAACCVLCALTPM